MNNEPAGEAASRPRRKPPFIERIHRRRLRRPRHRRLKSTSVLPALLTLGNGLAGFASIHFATKDALGEAKLANLATAAWLILVAMICDLLDGRLARMRRQTSDFGGQLDSLSDVISFGVAPAILMLRTTVYGMRQFSISYHGLAIERVVWCIAAVYVSCAVMRLARFNVENEPDESAHMEFGGLPSPGAAAPIMTLVLLMISLLNKQWVEDRYLLATASVILPIVTLAMALLMVSRFRYVHLPNQYIRGKKPFEYIIKLLVLLLIGVLQPFVAGAVFAIGFALSGPIGALWRTSRAPTPADQGVSQPAKGPPGTT